MPDSFSVDDDVAYASRVRSGVGRLGGGFFVSDEAKQAGKDLGLRGWPTYFVGRCGVLGPVEADVVASVCGFFPIDFVRKAWGAAQEVDLDLSTEIYLQACRAWGRRHLEDFASVGRLADLAEVVVNETSPVGAPLFAGWRTFSTADDDAARAVQALTTLRELRGGLHLAAVISSGLDPREAVLAGPGGQGNASFFGWADLEISPDREDFVTSARAEAERRTDRMLARSWSVLGLSDRSEFATLLDRAETHAFGAPLELAAANASYNR